MRSALSRSRDTYLREQMNDLEDLSNRLLRHLMGAPLAADLPDDAVVVAHTMGAAELLDYDRTKLRGVILQEGTQLSHVAIVARALNIPLVSACSSRVEMLRPA